MPAAPPQNDFVAFPCTGILNEWTTPRKNGGSTLTDCDNIIYHRNGTWGKRPGAHRAALPSGLNRREVSGFRWYRAVPSPLTKLVVYSQGHLWIGNAPSSLLDTGQFDLSTPGEAPRYCSARDPQANQGNGADILIITGLILPNGSPATTHFSLTMDPDTMPTQPPLDATVAITVTNGAFSVTTSNYRILGTDTPASILNQLCLLLNATGAFINDGTGGNHIPFLNESYFIEPSPTQPVGQVAHPMAKMFMGALIGGPDGNNITYKLTLGAGWPAALTFSPNAGVTYNFTGGGNPWSGPARYEAGRNDVIALSYMAPNAFGGCATWHSHVFFWADPNNPDTVFASDLDQPEAFTFMIQNGGMNSDGKNTQNGGYDVGPGDGDSPVHDCIPLGNALYIFKTDHIYMMEGYDFQTGEYEFSVTPQIVGYGVPSSHCVVILEGQLVAWTGKKFIRVQAGAYEPEHISLPIPLSEGLAAAGNQMVIRAAAGDFQVQTLLNGRYVANGKPASASLVLRSLAVFAVDFGDGQADTILVFDDQATGAAGGEYAWTKFTGWNVGCWITYGQGPNPAGTDTDKPLLWFVNPGGEFIHLFGGNPVDDWGNPIPYMVQTGWVDFATPEVIKDAERFFLHAETTAGANFTTTIIPGRIIPPQPNQIQTYSTQPQTVVFNPTVAPTNAEACNELEQYIQTGQPNSPALPIQAKSIMVQINEDGTSFAGLELTSWGLDVIKESLAT